MHFSRLPSKSNHKDTTFLGIHPPSPATLAHPEVLERRRAREAKAIAAMQAQMAAALAANPTLAEVPASSRHVRRVSLEYLGIRNIFKIISNHNDTFAYFLSQASCFLFFVFVCHLKCTIVFDSCFVKPDPFVLLMMMMMMMMMLCAGLKAFNAHIHSMDIHPPLPSPLLRGPPSRASQRCCRKARWLH